MHKVSCLQCISAADAPVAPKRLSMRMDGLSESHACRHFSPGEPVILEDPLLFTDEEDESGTCDLVYEAHQQFGIRALVDGRDASLDFGQQVKQGPHCVVGRKELLVWISCV